MTHSVKYATEYRNANNVIYLVNLQELSYVISPDTKPEVIEKYGGYLYHSTALRLFPKRINKGIHPIHYGYKCDFTDIESLIELLREINQ